MHRPSHHRHGVQVLDDAACQGMHDIRDNGCDDHCVDLLRIDPPVFQYAADRHSVFIRSALTLCRHAEHAGKELPVKHPHCDIRISHIDRKQHSVPTLTFLPTWVLHIFLHVCIS